ncbi:MAG: hypothetical protein HKN12_00200, partial [Gemmatimonadetes bacterium]|nr:hypothetical protein [Gemmatimonadota bacterium]
AEGQKGHWGAAAGGEQLQELQAEEIERLRAIGYLSGEEEAPASSGVVHYDETKAWPGRVLYSSGHAPMTILMERDGTPLHIWKRSFQEAFPGVDAPKDEPSFHYFRKSWLYPNGDLLIIFEGKALMKLDKDSNILWAHRNGAHHDFHVYPDGNIMVLTREAHVVPSYHPKQPVLEDFLSILDPDGNELQRYSLLEAVQNSAYAGLLDHAPPAGDVLHTNTLEVLDGSLADRSSKFGAGNVVVSFNRISVMGVVDLDGPELVWSMAGISSRNHDPTFLKNGNMLYFDNSGSPDGMSRVVEIDPFTQEVVWAYTGDEENGFYSECCGTNYRLPNGNTLIAETGAGRAFEVTPDQEIVWEFLNPHRAGENNELIAYVPEMVPVDDALLEWLE